MFHVRCNLWKSTATRRLAVLDTPPYLDYRPIDEDEWSLIKPLLEANWLNKNLESDIKDYAVEHLISEHFDEVKARREMLVQKTIRAVQERLTKEIHYWDNQAYELGTRSERTQRNVWELSKHLWQPRVF